MRSRFWSAAFLMATSAIGPGFITQTTVFTERLGASFGFVILCSIALDLAAQLNIWRIIVVSERRAQDVANGVAPGLGHVLALLVALGGLAFNIGNIAGAGLGIEVLTGWPVGAGAVLSAAIALAVFWTPGSGGALDVLARVLGVVMIALMGYVALAAHAPMGEVLWRSVVPERFDGTAVLTIVGGTVGGYISFAGAHRLLDTGISGAAQLPRASRASVRGVLLASAMRVLLFVAALGVVGLGGATLDAANPAADVFRRAAGTIGYALFGVVLWCAAITSVIGSAYTSVSFLKTLHPALARHERMLIGAIVIVSTAVFLVVGRPVRVLVVVGTLNGLILPLALGAMLLAARRPSIVGAYRHNRWLEAAGWLTVAAMGALMLLALFQLF